mmetsp:Transcript_29361/g.49738  ORF Transcript_29361/g.49738 Transcript_29361/m.49738 type:complete len:446 (+) Transcript_29361:100-1437(+)
MPKQYWPNAVLCRLQIGTLFLFVFSIGTFSQKPARRRYVLSCTRFEILKKYDTDGPPKGTPAAFEAVLFPKESNLNEIKNHTRNNFSLLQKCMKTRIRGGSSICQSFQSRQSLNISKFAAKKELHRCEEEIRRLRSLGVQPTTKAFSDTIVAFIEDGRTSRAEHWYSEMSMEGLDLPVSVFAHILEILAKNPTKDLEATERWVYRTVRRNYSFEPGILVSLSNARMKLGSFRQAETFLSMAIDRNSNVTAKHINDLVISCARGGSFARVEKWRNKLREEYMTDLKPMSFLIIIWAAAEKEVKEDKIMAWMRILFETYSNHPDLDSEQGRETIQIVAKRLGDIGKWQEARTLLYNAVEAGITPNADACSYVVRALVDAEEIDLADELLERMIEARMLPNTIAFTSYINHCVRSNSTQKAEHWLQRCGAMNAKWAEIFRRVPTEHLG